MRHVYYGDFLGTPGTVVTFFPDERFAGKRVDGKSNLSGIRFAIPQGSLDFWAERLEKFGFDRVVKIGCLQFKDFDEISIELCETERVLKDWQVNILSDIPAQMQLTGLLGTNLTVPDPDATTQFFEAMANYLTGINLQRSALDAPKSQWGRGSVDHIAFQVEDKHALDEIWEKAEKLGFMRESYVDRGYFSSVYLLEPGGNRIEFATLTPGFTLDESISQLGSTFALPPRYEARRAELLRYFAKQNVDFDRVVPVKFDENVTVKEGEVHRDTLHL